MERTKHKTNRGKNSYEKDRFLPSFALGMHYVYSLLFLHFYAILFFSGQNPLVLRGKGPPKYISFMVFRTVCSC